MTDREAIELALQQVQSGELTPAEAANVLLAESASISLASVLPTDSPPAETLASLLSRLGSPPADIVRSWCQQIRSIAAQYERETGEPLPAIELDQWSITPRGEVICNDSWFKSVWVEASPVEEASQASMDRIHEFHDTLVSSGRTALADMISPNESLAASVPMPPNQPKRKGAGVGNRAEPQVGRRVGPMARRVLFAVALLGCVGAAGVVLYNASRPETELTADKGGPASTAVPRTSAPDAEKPPSGPASTKPVFSGSPDSAETLETLETLESMTEAELSSIEAAESEITDSFSLDDLMPPVASFVPTDNSPGEPDASQDDQSPAASAMPRSDSVEDLLAEDEVPPDESPQKTRTRPVMAVALSDIDEPEVTELSASELTGLRLDFPFDVPLELGGDESAWEIRDTRKDMIVASVTTSRDGTQLKWAAGAEQSPNASALVHGRITAGDGGTIFLRPAIESDPWAIRVDQPDVMPTWNLAYPIPPRVTRISIRFDLPDGVEEAWIEPIDPESLRRGRGLAVLTPAEGETVSLGLRFDVRCGRKLSCRVRYAGRLDPSMPWQVVSAGLLDQFANQLTQQATLVSNERARLSRVYEIAGSAGRRILRVKQDRNDSRAEVIRNASTRVAQLQSLISKLEAEAALNIRVWVEWPGTEQTLLTMTSESADEP